MNSNKSYYEEFEKFIDEYVSRIREILEYVLEYKLYLPTHFNSNIIENILNIPELNDESIEGIRLKDRPAFSVQYHPESSPGPHDSRYLFEDFLNLI
jgi:anthranilate/para-aminobenzoate synthase component II